VGRNALGGVAEIRKYSEEDKMKCINCRQRIRFGHDREFGNYVVCNFCMMELLDLTRETGGEAELIIELAHEIEVDRHISAVA
jgi:hypothetical protein